MTRIEKAINDSQRRGLMCATNDGLKDLASVASWLTGDEKRITAQSLDGLRDRLELINALWSQAQTFGST